MSTKEIATEKDNASQGSNGGDSIEFMEFKKRISRLVEDLIKYRPNLESVWGKKESVEMKLETNEVKLSFSINKLELETATSVLTLFHNSFGPSSGTTTDISFSHIVGELNKAEGETKITIEKRYSEYNIKISTSIKQFNQHFEYFISELATLIYPKIEVEVAAEEKNKMEAATEALKNWYVNYGRGLEHLGCRVLLETTLTWEDLVGLEEVKKVLESNILMPLKREELFRKIIDKVFPHDVSIMPKGLLFYGPPGTGKTWSLRVLGALAGLPVVVLPCQALMSKWYGESEQILSQIFLKLKAAGKVILLIDELDAIARKRETSQETSARLVSIMLTELDGLDESRGQILLVASANNTDLIDPAVLDRFDIRLDFPYRARSSLVGCCNITLNIWPERI